MGERRGIGHDRCARRDRSGPLAARALAHEAAEYVFQPSAERNNLLDMRRSASAKRARDLDGRAALAALGECDSTHAALVSLRLTGRAFSGIECRRHRALASLSA